MANMHILEYDGIEVRVAVHVAIPNSNNAVGVNWRTALINSGKGGTTILVDGDGTAGTILGTEKTSIQNGSIYEVVTRLRPSGLSGVPLTTFLNAEYTRLSAAALAYFQVMLNYYGATV